MRVALCGNGRTPHTQRWANAVVDRGHDVALIWLREQFEGADLSQFRSSISHHAYDLPTVRRRPWFLPFALLQPSQLARRLQPELVHGLYLSGGGVAAHAMGVRPLVLTALGSDVSDLTRRPVASISDRLADAYLVRRTRRAVAEADVVLTDSLALAATIRERVPGADTRIVRFGVELAEPSQSARADWRARLGIGDDAFVALSSRLFRPQYNIDTIVRALPAIRRDLPNAVLVLKERPSVTDSGYRRRCLELVDELGVRDAVVLVGELEQQELLELHAAADVYLSVPSTDGTAVSALEAMAAGVPVVGSDAPGIDPVILRHEQTALLVPVRDPDTLAAAIVRIARDPVLRERIIAQARTVVERYGDFERELDHAVLLYEELVAGRA